MTPVVFLDFDGVLLTPAPRRYDWNPRAVAALNRLLRASGAEIVVSSTWRIGRTLSNLRGVLREHGVIGPVVGMTPVADQLTEYLTGRVFGSMRWHQGGDTRYVPARDYNATDQRPLATSAAIVCDRKFVGRG